MTTHTELGAVGSLWRYPVKSMMGEELNAAEVTERGLRGDRAYALVDRADGKVATAKNPRKWPHLFDFRATFIDPARAGAPAAPVRITLPNGTLVTSEQDDCNGILSRALARDVMLDAVARRDEEATSPVSPSARSRPKSTGPTWKASTSAIPSPISRCRRGRSSTVRWSIC